MLFIFVPSVTINSPALLIRLAFRILNLPLFTEVSLVFYVKDMIVLFMPNYSKKPLLTASDEEYAMLIEVSEEFEKQKIDKTAREKSGSATEIVIRNHLLRRNLNISMIPRRHNSRI